LLVVLDQLIGGWSYYGIFLLIFGINVAPFLMPPTWIVLASIHAGYPSFEALQLAVIGATAAVAGRSVLMLISSRWTRFLGTRRRSSLEAVGKYLSGKKYAFFVTSFLFALSPMPSNILFIGYGLMKRKTIGMFVGFWLGRVLIYFLMISVSAVAFRSFLDLFYDNLIGIIVIDVLAAVSILAFACLDWEKLIIERRLVFIRPSLRR
jgi:hypothetical protein